MTEILEIPEEYLEDVCKVIEAGIAKYRRTGTISDMTICALRKWVKDEREYLKRLAEE